MNITHYPNAHEQILEKAKALRYNISSDVITCHLLRSLAASKPNGHLLELGTGTGLSTAWILDGMHATSQLISVDNEQTYIDATYDILGHDTRLNLLCMDASEWIKYFHGDHGFDFIFADTW